MRGAFLYSNYNGTGASWQRRSCELAVHNVQTSRSGLMAQAVVLGFIAVLLVFFHIVPYDQRPCLWNQFNQLRGKKPRPFARCALRAIAF